MLDDCEHILTSPFFAHFQILRIYIVLFGKTHRCRQGHAVLVEGLVGGWTLDPILAVGLVRGERVDRDDEPTRRGKYAHIPMLETKLIQQSRKPLYELVPGRIHIAGRQFFDADLQQERRWTVDNGRWGRQRQRSMVYGLFKQRIFQLLALFFIAFRDPPCQLTHPPEIGLALGHADRAARIQDIEGVRRLEHIIVGRDDQPLGESGIRFGGVQVVHLAGTVHVRDLIIVFGVLELLPPADLAVGHPCAIFLIPDGFGIVESNEDALETVGQLHRDRVERHAAHLLEVGELGDLLPVQPDFPAQSPGRDGRLLPVVLHKADVVLAWVDAERLERLEIQLLRVARIRLEDDLELGVQLETVWVLAVAPIIRTD